YRKVLAFHGYPTCKNTDARRDNAQFYGQKHSYPHKNTVNLKIFYPSSLCRHFYTPVALTLTMLRLAFRLINVTLARHIIVATPHIQRKTIYPSTGIRIPPCRHFVLSYHRHHVSQSLFGCGQWH
ncbi:MAG: hypothetical protein ACO1QB_13225, partial [Verrucomicrobiales bacterium]